MAHTNLAYDYTLFEGNAAPRRRERTKPELRVVRAKQAAFSRAFSPQVLSTFCIVVTLVSLIVYNQVCLNEVTGDISTLDAEIARLESDSVRYASLLESTVSLRAVAEQAESELGMSRLDPQKTVYVSLYEGDRIILSQTQETAAAPSGGLLAAAHSFLTGVKEYFGLH